MEKQSHRAFGYDGRVVVVTGAGSGLGRSYALEFGRLGAKVVVNDTNAAASAKVVQEIIEEEGEAVANCDSVENGDLIIATALNRFGRIDALINNAGILRDKSFSRMTEADWESVLRVHLLGTFRCTKAAWPYFVRQTCGRVVNITSGSGLYGNFGQANYAAAKMAVVGFSKSVALEGARKNIHVNVVSPLADTQMTKDILPADVRDMFRPALVAPLVAFLAHPDCQVNGEVVEAGGGWMAQVRWQRSGGTVLDPGSTAADVDRAWPNVTDFAPVAKGNGCANVAYPTSPQDSLTAALEAVASRQVAGREASSTVDSAMSTCASLVSELWNESSHGAKVFILMQEYLKAYPDVGKTLVQSVGRKYQWTLRQPSPDAEDQTWIVDLKTDPASVAQRQPADVVPSVDATFIVDDADFVRICSGALNPQFAFARGKLRITGSLEAASKFSATLFPKLEPEALNLSYDKAVECYFKLSMPPASTTSPSLSQRTLSESSQDSETLQDPVHHLFSLLKDHLKTEPGQAIARHIGPFTYCLAIYPKDFEPSGASLDLGHDPVIAYRVDLKADPPRVTQLQPEGEAAPSDATLTLSDEALFRLVQGTLTVEGALKSGKLKTSENVHVALRFTPALFPKQAAL